MNNKDKKMIRKYSLIAAILILIVGLLDYFNALNFISKNLNFDFLNIFINALVIIFMFVITYLLIESKTLEAEKEKNNNKKGILILLLKKVCDECLNQISMLDEQAIVEKYLIPKIDFNATNNVIENNIKRKPFEYEEDIINLFSDGIIDKKYFSNYMKIKDCFENYVQWRIIFFDVKKKGRKDLELVVASKRAEILSIIEIQKNEMKKLEK